MEEGRGEGGKVALLLSLSQHSDESATLRRVKHLKELSIDNKRMYCGLHGYSLVIGEDLHSSRAADWDAVKLLAQHADQFEWWVRVRVRVRVRGRGRGRVRVRVRVRVS